MTKIPIAHFLSSMDALNLPEEYLDDCRMLAFSWDESTGIATFDDEAIAEIRATWAPRPTAGKPVKSCKSCGGL